MDKFLKSRPMINNQTKKTARQKQLERRPMKRSKKGNQAGLIKTAQLTRQNKRAGRKTYLTTQPAKQSADKQTVEVEKQPESINQEQAAINGNSSPMAGRTVETTRLAITRLLVAGVTDVSVIASKLRLGQKHIANQVKSIQRQAMNMNIDEYNIVLNTKLVQLLHNHTSSSSTIALDLHGMDCEIHDIDEQMKIDGDKTLALQRTKLAASRIALLREQRDSNASLFSTLSKVGVSQVALEKKKEGSIPLSPNNKNSDLGGSSKGSNLEVSKNSLVSSESGVTGSILDISGYGGVSKKAALAELERSTKQMERYLKSQEKGGQDGKD